MLRFQGSKRRISLTPLIDIVFILLVFFILETSYLKLGEVDLTLPTKESSGHAPSPRLVLQLYPDGRIFSGGRASSIDGLAQFIEAAGVGPQTVVVIASDDAVNAQLLVRCIDRLRAGGLNDIQLIRLEEL